MTTIPLPTSSPQPAAPPASSSPLSPDQMIEYQSALQRSKKVRRAIVVATTDAWLAAIFAGLTLLGSYFSLVALFLGLGLALVAFNSFRGLRGLKQFNLAAPRLLALNQLLLIAILTVYCLYSIWIGRNGDPDVVKAMAGDPALAGSLGDIKQISWYLTLAVYGTIIFVSLIAQGSAALYYITRRKHLQQYLSQTPPWIVALQKAQTGV